MLSKVLPRGSNRKDKLMQLLNPRVPPHLAQRFRPLAPAQFAALRTCLEEHYCSASDLATAWGQKDLHDHLIRRLVITRTTVVPWLDSIHRLAGATILEIGCGTGSSTIALAEQGAQVTAIDVSAASLRVARERCRIYNLPVDFCAANATDVHQLFRGQQFDFIIFYASLEHMTHAERMVAMHTTWEMLPPGGYWCVIETPNRLWYHDHHTALLPFYMWLPDDLALAYSRFSPRDKFRALYTNDSPETQLAFLRWGRGVSYHEFDLAIQPAAQLHVMPSLFTFLRTHNILRWLIWRFSHTYQYETLLARFGPNIHPGFYQSNLNLVIKKT